MSKVAVSLLKAWEFLEPQEAESIFLHMQNHRQLTRWQLQVAGTLGPFLAILIQDFSSNFNYLLNFEKFSYHIGLNATSGFYFLFWVFA